MNRTTRLWVRWFGFALMLLPFVVAAVGVGVFRIDFSHTDPSNQQKAAADAISFVYWLVGLGIPAVAAGFVMVIVSGGRSKPANGAGR